MMNIQSAEINWMKGYANSPSLKVVVDRMAPRDQVVFKKLEISGGVMYWGQYGDFATFNFYTPGNTEGYGGRWFNFTLENGTVDTVKGPWSSNTGSMNQHFPACVEVSLYETAGAYPNLGYHGWNLMLPKFIELVASLGAEVAFLRDIGGEELTYDEAKRLDFKIYASIKLPGMSYKASQVEKGKR